MKPSWCAATAAAAAAMLALPLLLFAWLSYVKLGFVSWSYYVPYEEFSQSLAAVELRKIYYAPLVAVNVTSGFVIANMFTYTLGHTAVTLALVALVVVHLARAARLSAAPVGGATAGVCAATAASSSAALTGCCGAGMAGGIVALAGLGSATGAWMSDVATWAQLALVIGLGAALVIPLRRSANVEYPVAGRHPDLSAAGPTRLHRPVRSAGAHAGLEAAPAVEKY